MAFSLTITLLLLLLLPRLLQQVIVVGQDLVQDPDALEPIVVNRVLRVKVVKVWAGSEHDTNGIVCVTVQLLGMLQGKVKVKGQGQGHADVKKTRRSFLVPFACLKKLTDEAAFIIWEIYSLNFN